MVTFIHRATPAPSIDACVSVDLDSGTEERDLQCADVLYGTATHSPHALLRRYPGCLCVTLRSSGAGHHEAWCSVLCRNGGRLVLTGDVGMTREEHRRLAIAVHAWLARGLALDRLQAVRFTGHSSGQTGLSFRRRSSSRTLSPGLTSR
jgi:hypothetical protein